MTSQKMSPTEVAVSQMWGRIIGVQPTSTDSDFFELGGSSLHLMTFLDEVLATFGAELDLVELLASGFTVAESAAAIDRAKSGATAVVGEVSA